MNINVGKNIRISEGFSVKDDILPKRALAEPLPSGPAKGHVMELEKLRTEYYHLMG